jgi:glycosyltransferase involved in cell wall biosynthesis
MLTYNRPQLIGRAVESVVAQTLQDWELIVLQDGDNTYTLEIMTAWAKRDQRIRYLRRDRGGNIADATNFALEHARGDFAAILDDDDAWANPGKLEMQVTFLDSHPDFVACGGGAIVVDEKGAETLRYLKPESYEQIRSGALRANPIVHSTGMFRRETLRKLGNYDASLAGFQDWDVWLKLGATGKLYNFPDYFVYYTLWEGGGSFHSQRRNTRSALTIVCRHRHQYAHFAVALALALSYYFYSLLPLGFRRRTYSVLSRRKKAIFGQ